MRSREKAARTVAARTATTTKTTTTAAATATTATTTASATTAAASTATEDCIREKDVKKIRARIDSGRYNMSLYPRGKCLVINNVEFQTMAHLDEHVAHENLLNNLFQELGFEVVVRRNLTRDEIRTTAGEFAGEDHSCYDAFVFFILSHGGQKDLIFGVDGRTISVAELMCLFKSRQTLQGKPKLFFIDACRGHHADRNPSVRETTAQPVTPGTNPTSALSSTTWPQEADFLLAFSTTPGQVSWNCCRQGSFFVNALVASIRQNRDTLHLGEILMDVTNRVVAKTHSIPYFQVPAHTDTLLRHVYF